MKWWFLSVFLWMAGTCYAQFGPGGVGTSATNGIWLRAEDIGLNNNDSVALWPDFSGNSNNAVQNTPGRKPLYITSSSLNSRPAVRLDGSNDQMVVSDNILLDNTGGLNYFIVVRPNNLNGAARGIIGKRISFSTPTEYAFSFFFYSSNYINMDIATNDDRFTTSPTAFSNSTNYILNMNFDGSLAAAQRSKVYSNGTLVKTSTESSTTVPNSNQNLAIGALNEDYGTYLGADYCEIIGFIFALNTAQRYIVENYLGAKYNITIANDFYAYQASYGNEVAGIGQFDASNQHLDSKGSGLVRMNGATGLGNGEYVFWGHNGAALTTPDTTDVDGTTIQSRLQRVWRVNITGSIGVNDVSFDVSSFSPLTGSDLRLLIDRNGNGFADNDQTPATGSYSAGTVTFNNVNFSDGDYFTLGSVNYNQTPLPVTLKEFNAIPLEEMVHVYWTTLAEINNDFFTVERKSDKGNWEVLGIVDGSGNSRTEKHYALEDNRPLSGFSYYRLKQTDVDGNFAYSSPVVVHFEPEKHFTVFPNPSHDQMTVQTSNRILSFSVYDIHGKKVDVAVVNSDEHHLNLNVGNLSEGRYSLCLETVAGRICRAFIVEN